MDVLCHQTAALLPRLNEGVGFEYCGRMKESTVEILLRWAEATVKPLEWTVTKRKRFLRCLIELTQNLLKHGNSGRFCCHISPDGSASLMSSNVISNEQRIHLEQVLDQIQSTAFDALKAERLDKLVNGDRTSGGGAGLGLMDMRACTNDNLHSEFIPCNNGEFIFVMTLSFPS